MKTTTTTTPREFLSLVKGRFFSATFVKKNGEVRKGTFRTGVRKHVNGRGLAFNPDDYNLAVVWEPRKCTPTDKGYRMMNLETVQDMKCGDLVFTTK